MQFEEIVVIDNIDIPIEQQRNIQSLSVASVDFPMDDPADIREAERRASNADALLVSWRTPITARLFDACPSLRFVGLAASAFSKPESCNVDLFEARDRGIVVSTLGQYGDEATAEWIFAMMLNVASHISPFLHWGSERRELFGKTIGIVGMGHMGRQVAQRAMAFGMRVVYWSRNRKVDIEAQGCQYLPLHQLLEESDAVSVHVGTGVQVMGALEFAALKPGVMLVNTSLGPVFDPSAFADWLGRREGVVFSDKDVDPLLAQHMKGSPNAWISAQSAGDSYEMKQRKGEQLRENLRAFLDGSPRRIAPL